jgi:hypothetical protein
VRKNTVVPEAVVTVEEVKAFKTQSGNTRYVLRDSEGREFNAVPADDLFDRLQPFKERVADDIRASSDGDSGE